MSSDSCLSCGDPIPQGQGDYCRRCCGDHDNFLQEEDDRIREERERLEIKEPWDDGHGDSWPPTY